MLKTLCFALLFAGCVTGSGFVQFDGCKVAEDRGTDSGGYKYQFAFACQRTNATMASEDARLWCQTGKDADHLHCARNAAMMMAQLSCSQVDVDKKNGTSTLLCR